jgi:hypothetical protein
VAEHHEFEQLSQRAEEGDHVRLLLLGEPDVEARVVEVDDRVEVRRKAIVLLTLGVFAARKDFPSNSKLPIC